MPSERKEDKGKQFELFLEILLQQMGKVNVKRNVIYKKKSGDYREVDVQYLRKVKGVWQPVFVEAKYTSKDTLPFWLGEEKTKNGRTIDGINNHVKEIAERMRFAKGYQTVFATNKTFNHHIHEEIEYINRASLKEKGIKAIYTAEGPQLETTYKKLGGPYNLEEAISRITIKPKHKKQTYVHI